jgi:RNA polymerase sigma-70 factor (ECF subfamily)
MDDGFHDQVRRTYRELREGLYGFALALTGDRPSAEDAVQAAFFGLLRVGRMPREVRPYLFRAVRNAAADLRRDRRVPDVDAHEEVGRGDEALFRKRMVREALDGLAEPERQAVLLRVVGGLTIAETAVVLTAPAGTIASWYRRGLEKVRRALGSES